MNDTESARTGYTKLYHPRGPLVSLPVVGDNPASMFAYVTAMLDAGFVVAAPGLEVGEEREMVSGVLKSTFENDGEVTDTVLLYAANEAMEWSFLKLYLNSDADKQAFEAACGVKLESLLVYDGKDKPKRDGTAVAKKYIAKLARPAPVVFKQNPKWSEEESKAAVAANKPYTKPKRVFVRWADAAAPSQTPAVATPTPAASEFDLAVAAWKLRLEKMLAVDDMNKQISLVKAIENETIRKRAWTMCLEFAREHKWVLDIQAGVFRHAAEMPSRVPIDHSAAASLPPVAAPPLPPPPPDESAVDPIIAEWTKKLDPLTVNLDKLNGEVLAAFRAIPKGKLRDQLWVMLWGFSEQNGCQFDSKSMKFVDVSGQP